MRTTVATTLAWSTHPQKLVTFLGRACAPHGVFCKGFWPLAGARTSSKEFEVRAKVAREAPMDRNVEKPLVFERFSESAQVDFQIFWVRKSYDFICFLDIAS